MRARSRLADAHQRPPRGVTLEHSPSGCGLRATNRQVQATMKLRVLVQGSELRSQKSGSQCRETWQGTRWDTQKVPRAGGQQPEVEAQRGTHTAKPVMQRSDLQEIRNTEKDVNVPTHLGHDRVHSDTQPLPLPGHQAPSSSSLLLHPGGQTLDLQHPQPAQHGLQN